MSSMGTGGSKEGGEGEEGQKKARFSLKQGDEGDQTNAEVKQEEKKDENKTEKDKETEKRAEPTSQEVAEEVHDEGDFVQAIVAKALDFGENE